MNLTITVSDDFREFLKENYPEVRIEKSEEVVDNTYNNFISMTPGDIIINVLITYSPMIIRAIKDYVLKFNKNMMIKTIAEKYKVNTDTLNESIKSIERDAQ